MHNSNQEACGLVAVVKVWLYGNSFVTTWTKNGEMAFLSFFASNRKKYKKYPPLTVGGMLFGWGGGGVWVQIITLSLYGAKKQTEGWIREQQRGTKKRINKSWRKHK